MQKFPPLPFEETPGRRHKKNKRHTIESSTLGATPSGPPFEFDPPESCPLVSTEPKITYSFAGESDTVQT